MATESADGTEISLTLPSHLDEWLDARAADLDIDREELLLQLLSAYHAAADLEDGSLSELVDAADLEQRIEAELDERLEETPDPEVLEARVETLESDLDENIEDLRSRVIQVRDAVKNRADKDHDHPEIEALDERLDATVGQLETLTDEVKTLSERAVTAEEDIEDAESKLNRLARVVVALRNEVGSTAGDDDQLEHLRKTANELAVDEAKCGECRRGVKISLLTEPACPHCETAFRDVKRPDSILGRTLDPRKPRLVVDEPPALESGDE